MKTILKYWLLIAIVVTGLSGLIYGVVQQDIRLGANDPQIQMAEDAAARLANGEAVQSVVPAEKVDIAKSLAPYIMVFDAGGKPVASSAQLGGQTPIVPSGVFDSVRRGGEDRITWQPQAGVRSAVVITRFSGSSSGFVLVGRSLREAEERIDGIGQIVLVGWGGMLLVSLLAVVILLRIKQMKYIFFAVTIGILSVDVFVPVTFTKLLVSVQSVNTQIFEPVSHVIYIQRARYTD